MVLFPIISILKARKLQIYDRFSKKMKEMLVSSNPVLVRRNRKLEKSLDEKITLIVFFRLEVQA